jgi:hypothetical protein
VLTAFPTNPTPLDCILILGSRSHPKRECTWIAAWNSAPLSDAQGEP